MNDAALGLIVSRLREETRTEQRPEWVRTSSALQDRRTREKLVRAIAKFEEGLLKQNMMDEPQVVELALAAVERGGRSGPAEYRCVLADEAQDLSTNELTLLAKLTPNDTDALTLVGDYAQRIFRRRGNLRKAGISISPAHQFVLKKNYRNTNQIISAARALLVPHGVRELEERRRRPLIDVDLPSHEGGRPLVLQFSNAEKEMDWVAKSVAQERTETGAGVAILCLRDRDLERLKPLLEKSGLKVADLAKNVVPSAGTVKLSTIGSAKGHEFSHLYIVGLNSTFPQDPNNSVWEASRMYVAMTRARDSLTLTWSGSKPSAFVETMQDYCSLRRGDSAQTRTKVL